MLHLTVLHLYMLGLKMEFPKFKYHQNPIKSLSFIKSDMECNCCNKKTGYIYNLSIYSSLDVEDVVICPWCLANGDAAKKYQATFNDTYSVESKIPNSENDEILHRTPSYPTWQDFDWMIHCGHPAIFIGDADKSTIKKMSSVTLSLFLKENELDNDEIDEILDRYIEVESPMIYEHKCSKCNETLYSMEYS